MAQNYYGYVQIALPFGDGFRCIGGQTFRNLPFSQADGLGNIVQSVDLNLPGIQLGSVLFQNWYRDPKDPLGSGFNLSDAVEVIFVP